MTALHTVSYLASELRAGRLTSFELVTDCLKRIENTEGEGSRSFIFVDAEAVRHAAAASDELRSAGVDLSPLMGLPLSTKDLFDVSGQVTTAGSKIRSSYPPAARDALTVARLRQAGGIIIGRTNMTEFAYSGLGLNPHYGTPANPYDRAARRIPGGSSSGAAVSVADGMAVVGLGTDTGGSVRIPSALCGITGFKPTARRIPLQGVLPLAESFDSVGPLAASVACCVTVDQVLAGRSVAPLSPFPLQGLRLALPSNVALEDLDDHVGAVFERALATLARAGASVVELYVNAFDDIRNSKNGGRLLASEAYAAHRPMLEEHRTQYDPRVSGRLQGAANLSAAEYIDLRAWRRRLVDQAARELSPYDALILPTTPRIAPGISELEADDALYHATNGMMLRNTALINQIDGCALSLPCHREGEAPVGLMIAGVAMQDDQLLSIGLSAETALGSA